MKTLAEIAYRRWSTNVRAAEAYGLPPIKIEVFQRMLKDSYESGFKCPYCKKQMRIQDTEPYFLVPSFDHKISLDLGGPNTEDNLWVVCHQCNTVKGTMTAETFIKLLSLLDAYDPFLKVKIYDEWYRGHRAAMLKRKIEKGIYAHKS